jgi:hypothetical protein
VDNEIPQPKRVPPDATPMQLVFLLGDDPSAPVDVELHWSTPRFLVLPALGKSQLTSKLRRWIFDPRSPYCVIPEHY